MSRIGKQPVTLPAKVAISVADGTLNVQGPKGQLARPVAAGIEFEQTGNVVSVVRESDSPTHRANHGLMRALLANMVTGVTTGFERQLEIKGVGYKAEIKGTKLVLNLGYSHPIEFPFPAGVTIEVAQNTRIAVKGMDKELVGQAAAEIRSMRPPDSYKGKGVRYQNEHVRLKAGKSAQK